MHATTTTLLSCVFVLASSVASAQQTAAPWTAADAHREAGQTASPAVAPASTQWPTIVPRSVNAPLPEPLADSPRESLDAASDHFFQLPTARTLRLGDLMGRYVSHLGWAGVRYGLTRSLDVGVGVPFYFTGVSADVRVSFLRRRGLAMSWWGYLTVPFKLDGETPSANLGFTWAYAGLGWLTGPLISVWNNRVGVHIGLHGAQRTGLGGLWFVAHATVDVRIVEGVKVIAQGFAMYEVSEERADRARSLLGNGRARFMPYALLGMRFSTRRFAADVGALVPLSSQSPLYSEGIAALPWMSLSHLF
jgi:hypothetical protein